MSIVFENIDAEVVIRKLLKLPLEYFQIQSEKIKHTEFPVGSASAGGGRPSAGDVGHAGTSAPVRRRILPDRRIT